MVDEAHMLLGQNNTLGADFLANVQRRARKYNTGTIVITQQPSDFTNPEVITQGKAIFDNSSYYLVMGLRKQAAEDLAQLLDINENEIEEWCGRTDDDGNERWVPATPLGYRDYEISRAEGLKNIFAQEEVTATFDYDAFHSIKKEEVPFKQYDKIVYDDTPYIVVGDDDEKFYIVDEYGDKYYVNYAGNQSTEL